MDAQILAGALLAGAVGVSVLAIGAVHLPVLLVVAALSFAAAAVALHRQAQGRDGLVVPLPTVICGALAAYTLLQMVPLPIHWLEVVAPSTADIWQRSLLPFGEPGPRWASISLDPGASAVEVLRWTTYGAVFAAAATISGRHGASSGLYIVFGAAVIAALVTLGHGLAEATRVYGLYQPEFRTVPWHVGPLLNANNLAGYLNLGALTGLGLMLADRPHVPRWLIGLGVTLIVGIELTAASRAGVGSLLVGVGALALFTRGRADARRGPRRMSSWMLLGVVTAGGVLAILGGTDRIWTELYDKDLSKLTMLLWAKPLLRDHGIFGIGRGAFESVFPVYRTMPGNYVYTHAENFVVQWAAEWGVPVALATLGILGWAFTPRRLGAVRSTVAAGAWCGVAVLLLQNLVDLGLEIPALCVAAATALGSLWGDKHRARAREALRIEGPLAPARAQQLALAIGTLGAALAILVLAVGRHDVDADRRAVRDSVDTRNGRDQRHAPAAARRLLHQAMLRHPAEPYFPLVGAMLAFQGRTDSPIPWLQRSLERAQVNGRAHLLLAEVLAARGTRQQALLELRLAVTDDPAVDVTAATLATRWTQSYDDLAVVLPEGKLGGRVLAAMASVSRADHPPPARLELARRCEREAIARDPDLVDPRYNEASDLIDALMGLPGAPPCLDRAACRARILEHIDAISRVLPASWLPPTLRARLLVAEDKPEEAVKLLEGECRQLLERSSCLRVRVFAAAKVKAPAMLDSAARDLLGISCVSSPTDCAEVASWLATVRAERGENAMAIGLLERAAREDASNPLRWMAVADAAARAGQHGLALDALERVARTRGGADPELQKRIEAERSQAFGILLRAPR